MSEAPSLIHRPEIAALHAHIAADTFPGTKKKELLSRLEALIPVVDAQNKQAEARRARQAKKRQERELELSNILCWCVHARHVAA